MESVISAVGLTKIFRDFWHRARVKAVDNVDFEVRSGEIFGLLGPNGSGKSTTIKIILGLLHPTRGSVSVFNRPPDDVKTKSRIGYLPEESYSYRFLNARETLDYYGTLFQIPRRERKRRIEELLEMVGLKSAARRPVGEYSKGMQRRIGLAQALINDPELLILDEPTSGLDPIGANLVKEIIKRLGHEFKKTILLSSHLLADVEEVCNRVTILYGGKVQVAGRMEDVLARRDMMQINCERLSPETLAEVEAVIRRRENKSLTVATPRDRLETLFLRIVHTAHAQSVETSGAQSAGGVAGFLGEQQQATAELDALVHIEAEPPRPAAAGAPAKSAVDDSLLTGLAQAGRPAPRDVPPAERRPAEPDRSLLDDLTGGNEGGR